MQTHKFKIVGGDTDSIMFCKPDMAPFSKDEQNSLLTEINSLLPTEINFANDGIFTKVIYLKTKNYIMVDEHGNRKLKGSSIKSSTLEPILKTMLGEMIDLILDDRFDDLRRLPQKYIDMANNITDIGPWCSKKTLSPTTYNSTRKNETDIIKATEGKEYKSGDRIYLFTKSAVVETGEVYKRTGLPKTKKVKVLSLKEDFAGDYDIDHYIKRIKAVADRFKPVLPEGFFID